MERPQKLMRELRPPALTRTLTGLLMAAALLLGAPLLTRDAAHFQRVPSLCVETY